MLYIKTLTGPYSTNTYLVCGKSTCVVIDPSGDADVIYRALLATEKAPAAILLTHGHFDHIDALEALTSRSDIPVYISAADASMLTDPYLNAGWLIGETISAGVKDLHTLSGGEIIAFDDMTIQVYATPGHTAGSLCYLIDDAFFTGDTVFADGYGRTDLPNARADLYAQSLMSIAPLLKTKNLYPGHGRKIILKE